MNLQKRKSDLEKLHKQGCHDMAENELCTSELYMHIIRVNFPATQAKIDVSPQCPFYHNWEYSTSGTVEVPLALRAYP